MKMKKSLLVLACIFEAFVVGRTAYAVDVAFATNGVIVAVPIALPVVGVRLDTQQVVFNLLAAGNEIRNACGYFPVQRFDRATLATNDYVAAISWRLDPPFCVEDVTIGTRVPRVEVDRVKLAGLVKAHGWTEAFQGFVNADPEISVRWYSSEPLVAGSDEMRPFIEAFAVMIGVDYEQALALLEQCRTEVRR